MSRSFFTVLKMLEKSSADGKLPDKEDALLRRLIRFVEGGSFTKSETDKFILENFRLSSAEMTGKWNDLHFDRQKEDGTFRGQISVLGHYVGSLFSVTADELLEAFLSGRSGVLNRTEALLEAFTYGDFDLSGRFSAVIQGGFLSAYETDAVYEMKDCSREIQFLKSFDRSTIQKRLEKVDMDKLVYVMQTIRRPLVTDMRVEMTGKKKKVKTARVNLEKLEFCNIFSKMKAGQPECAADMERPLPDAGTAAFGVEKLPYRLKSGRTLSDMLTQRSKDRMTDEEAARWWGMTEAQREEEKKRLVKLLMVFTEEGFQKQLKRYSPLTVQEVLDGDYPQNREEQPAHRKKACSMESDGVRS